MTIVATPPPTEPLPETAYRMQCMELWGGISAISRQIEMNGLQGYVYSRPFEQGESGGDVYYFTSCASGRISRILLADVTGHGTAVSDTARKLRTAMRRNVNVIGQQKLMSFINREFADLAATGLFATGLLLTYFAPLNRLSLSLAGHPPPLIYRRSTGRWSLLETRESEANSSVPALPLGVSNDAEYPPANTRFEPGDLVLAYTDAFIEARGANGQLLQVSGLLDIVRKAPDIRFDRLVSWLVETISELHPENLSTDDCTAIVVEPSAQRIPLTDTLLAPLRMARGVHEVDVAER